MVEVIMRSSILDCSQGGVSSSALLCHRNWKHAISGGKFLSDAGDGRKEPDRRRNPPLWKNEVKSNSGETSNFLMEDLKRFIELKFQTIGTKN